MSTFDGFVKEFPNIRIDYFRLQPGRPPPAACFLSHVHSDHLQGLESLKMPFVYCSATTRKLLLRMEKYPHRINFAKGTLESRKQHYRHLRLVLRALPLQTATEIELAPKSKIRVTLFDANHCPGAVMFLIEGNGKAILYTGDIRSEPWWVNSLIQNPFILPFACGQRRLDCIYLDTTFASRHGDYKDFTSKAEGLKELSGKLTGFPNDTIYYFRSWTLGYENVWIMLSNMLNSQIHVDDYQLRLFGSLIENGRDGYSMFEGPALAGFTFGNHEQSGCLTHNTDVRIHSCEPGTACHTQLLKKENVVWITPIVSRLADGTEIRELGAGGGLGDLYQTPELEINDPGALQALDALCTDLVKDVSCLKRIQDAISHAKMSGSLKLSMEGLGLDIDAEISLKDFIRIISTRDKWKDAVSGTTVIDHTLEGIPSVQRIIHFPYSRHSSYGELRHLISTFRPKDICACTVELESWSEETSMASLFGDLCSENIFYHDREVRQEVQDFRDHHEKINSLKRKRGRSSPDLNSQEHSGGSEQFQSAATALETTSEPERRREGKVALKHKAMETDSVSRSPPVLPQQLFENRSSTTTNDEMYKARIEAVKLALQKQFDLLDSVSVDSDDSNLQSHMREADPQDHSQISLTMSAFEDSRDPEGESNSPDLNGINDLERQNTQHTHQFDSSQKLRRSLRRLEAYRAARRSLRTDDASDWEDLNVRSIGQTGHTLEEVEL